MNQELTQRIIGAIVVTALAAIFLPMFFDDPVDDDGQTVDALEIPAQRFPGADDQPRPPASAAEVTAAESALTEQEMLAEPPAGAYISEEEEFVPVPAKPAAPKAALKPADPAAAKPHKAPPAAAKPPAAQPKPAAAEPDKAALRRWYVQAGSFGKKENAQALADKLKQQGLPVLMETIQTADKGTLYRLRVGPELDKKRAQAIEQQLRRQQINAMLMAQ